MATILDPKTGIIVAAPKSSDQWTDAKKARRWLTWALSKVVSDTACATLPASPVEGQSVIVSGGANANSIARYSTDLNAWEYLAPWAGLTVQDSTGASWSYSASGWALRSSGGGGGSSAVLAVGDPGTPDTGVVLFADYAVANLVPEMTGNTSQGCVASASSEYNPAWYAFNSAITNGWLSNGTPTGWLQLAYDTQRTILSYAVRPWDSDNFPSRAPTEWTLQGSSTGDDGSWTVLDTRSVSSSSWGSGVYQTFQVASPGAYKYYRLVVSANGGNGYLGIHTLRLIGVDQTLGYAVWAKNSQGKKWVVGGAS